MRDPTKRFTSRVDNYIRYRPSYPPQVLQLLRDECGLTPADRVADVGSGTGILSRLFLENGNPVYGVEPNQAMREAGERFLSDYERFTNVEGTAEATTLPDTYVDFIMAGQAFHWFDMEHTREEWQRILKPDGWAVLVWNSRQEQGTPFLSGYEQLLLDYGTDYEQVAHRKIGDDEFRTFFRDGTLQCATFPNQQSLTYEALEGRLLSSSYTPEADHPNHEPMLRELRRLFEETQEDGGVIFAYITEVFYGRL